LNAEACDAEFLEEIAEVPVGSFSLFALGCLGIRFHRDAQIFETSSLIGSQSAL
jgi:hypothetical protein